jgi:hypothetical protein
MTAMREFPQVGLGADFRQVNAILLMDLMLTGRLSIVIDVITSHTYPLVV